MLPEWARAQARFGVRMVALGPLGRTKGCVSVRSSKHGYVEGCGRAPGPDPGGLPEGWPLWREKHREGQKNSGTTHPSHKGLRPVLLRNLAISVEMGVTKTCLVPLDFGLYFLGLSNSNFCAEGAKSKGARGVKMKSSLCSLGPGGCREELGLERFFQGSCGLWKEFQLGMGYTSDFSGWRVPGH